jgi:Domain of unknown function (DUF5666)
MNSKRLILPLILIAVLPLSSCSGLKGGCSTNCGGGNATLSMTLYDTPPTGLNLLTFTLPIAGISLTPSSGSAVNVTTAVSSVEATRLQTDSALIVDAFSVVAGSFTGINVTLGPTSATSNVFINTSGSTITWTTGSGGSCASGAVCSLPAGAVFTVPVTLSLTLTANQSKWIGLNLNLANAITTSGGLNVDFSQTGVLTAITTPRTGLPTGAADTVEDFTGVVTAYSSGSSITVQSGISGQKITAVLNSSTEYDTPPNGSSYTGCTAATAQSCIAVGSTVSVDASLAASGTLTATEVDLLDTKAVDEVEGVIYPTSNAAVFGLLLADKVSASGNSVLAASTTTWGTPFFLTVIGVNIFATDTKTLSSQFTPVGFSSTGDLLAGQQVRVQLTNITSTNTGITATAKNMLLRFSRLAGSPSNIASGSFNFTPPGYVTFINTTLPAAPLAYTYTSTAFDGITGTGDPNFTNGSTAAIRALFVNNTQPTFAVAKIRVP